MKGSETRTTAVPGKTDAVTPSTVRAIVQDFTGANDVKVVDLPTLKGGAATDPGASTSGTPKWVKSPWGWVLCGVGLAGVATGGALVGLFAKYRDDATAGYSQDELLSDATKAAAVASRQDLANKAVAFRAGGVAALSIGVAAIAGGIVMFVLTEKGIVGGDDERSAAGPQFAIVPTTVPGGGGVVGTVTF